MPLFGELFICEIIKKPVFDPTGGIAGRVKDIIVIKGDPLPKVAGIVVEKKKQLFRIKWEDINLFNKRIISTYLIEDALEPYLMSDEDLLAARDILGKQIVDITGAKIVKANDIMLEGYEGEAVLVAIEIGIRGKLRMFGIERFGEKIARLFRSHLPHHLITWNYIQPLKPKLHEIALTVPKKMVSELHPAEIAELIRRVPADDGSHLIKDLDIETVADTLSELEPGMRTEIISEMDAAKAADIIEVMPPDDAADTLGDLPTERVKEIMEHIEKDEFADIQELLLHQEDTAGGLMTNEFISYPPNITVAQAIEKFKKDAEEIETVYYIYVTEHDAAQDITQDEKLVGVTSLRELLLAESDRLLAEIMETKIIKVAPDEDVEIVAKQMSKYDLAAMPVVDKEGHLLGIVTIDDIIDVVTEEATEDIYRIAGTSEVKFGNIEQVHPIHIVRSRLPWLLLCLLGGLISSIVVGHFEATLTAIVVLAAFIPVIMGMAGNAGLQVSTTLVRNIALNSINNHWRYAGKELFAGFMTAGITGVLIAIAAGALKGMPMLGLVVGLAMFLSISSSIIIAILMPTIAEKIGIDPAITAGPFVTVFNDILGLTIYFTVATIFMRYLL
jgi:magnesium transporter